MKCHGDIDGVCWFKGWQRGHAVSTSLLPFQCLTNWVTQGLTAKYFFSNILQYRINELQIFFLHKTYELGHFQLGGFPGEPFNFLSNCLSLTHVLISTPEEEAEIRFQYRDMYEDSNNCFFIHDTISLFNLNGQKRYLVVDDLSLVIQFPKPLVLDFVRQD